MKKVSFIYSSFDSLSYIIMKRVCGPVSASLRPGNTAFFEEMSQRWQAVGNTVSALTGPRFEPLTSRFRGKSVTARPTGRSNWRQCCQRLATAARFLRKKPCCPGAMTRRWAPNTRYTIYTEYNKRFD